MQRRITVLLAACLLALSAGRVTAFHNLMQPCDDLGKHQVFANIVNPGGAANAEGVSAYIDISGTSDADSWFGTCALAAGGVAAYVRLVDKTSANAYSALSLGVTRCYDDVTFDWGTNVCRSGQILEADPRYFITYGGCGSFASQFFVDDPGAGSPGYGPHTYRIARSGSNPNLYRFLIDGVNYKQVDITNSKISCWINKNKGASYAGETIADGDIVGAPFSHTTFNALEVRPAGGAFSGVTPTGCFTSIPNPDEHPFNCSFGTQLFEAWNYGF